MLFRAIFLFLFFSSFMLQGQNVKNIMTSSYNFNTGAVRTHTSFTPTSVKQGPSTIFDATYGLKRHFDFTIVTSQYKQSLLSDTFVDTSFIYKKEIPGTTGPAIQRNASVTDTTLNGFVLSGLANLIFN